MSIFVVLLSIFSCVYEPSVCLHCRNICLGLLPFFDTELHVPCHAKSLQLCPTLCDSTDCHPQNSSVRGDSPGKNTGVGCHFLLQCLTVRSESEVAQSCPTLSNPMDYSLPGSSTHGIFQARVLEWGAIAFSRRTLWRFLKKKTNIEVPYNPEIPLLSISRENHDLKGYMYPIVNCSIVYNCQDKEAI